MKRGDTSRTDSDGEISIGIPGSVSPCTPRETESVPTNATLGDVGHMSQDPTTAAEAEGLKDNTADSEQRVGDIPAAKRPGIGEKTGGSCLHCGRDAYRLDEAEVPVCCLICYASQGVRHTYECNIANEDDVTLPNENLRTADIRRAFSLKGVELDPMYSDPNLLAENLGKHYCGQLPKDQEGPWSFIVMAKCLDRADPPRWPNFLSPILQEHYPSEHLAKDPNMTESELQELRQQEISNWCTDFEQASLPQCPPSEIVVEAVWEICCALDSSITDPEERQKRKHLLLWDVHERMSLFSRGILEIKPLAEMLLQSNPDASTQDAAEKQVALSDEIRKAHGIPMEWISEKACRKLTAYPLRKDEEVKRCILREPTAGPVDDESDVEYDDVRTSSGLYNGSNVANPHWNTRVKFVVNGTEIRNFLFKFDRWTRIGSLVNMILSEINGEWNCDPVDVRVWDTVYPFRSPTHRLNWAGDRKRDIPQTFENTRPRMLSPDALVFTAVPVMGAVVVTATNQSYAKVVEQTIAHTLSRDPKYQQYYYKCKSKGFIPLIPMFEHDLRDRRGRPYTRRTARCITLATLTWIDMLTPSESNRPKSVTIEDEDLDLPDFDVAEGAYNIEHHNVEAQVHLIDPMSLAMNPYDSVTKSTKPNAEADSQRKVLGLVGEEYFIPLMERYQGDRIFVQKEPKQRAKELMFDVDLVFELQLHHCVNVTGKHEYSQYGPHCDPVHSQLNIKQVAATVVQDQQEDHTVVEMAQPPSWRRRPDKEILLPLPFKELERTSQSDRLKRKRPLGNQEHEPSSSEAKRRRGFSIEETWNRWIANALDQKPPMDQVLPPKESDDSMTTYFYKFLLSQLSLETDLSERQRLNNLRYQVLTSELTEDEDARTYLCNLLGLEPDRDRSVEDPHCSMLETAKHSVFNPVREWITPFDVTNPVMSFLNSRLRIARLNALLRGHSLEAAEKVNRAIEDAVLHDALTILKTRDCQAFECRQWLQNAHGSWPDSVQPWHIANPSSVGLSSSLQENLVTFAKDICRRYVSDDERALSEYFKSAMPTKVAHAILSYATQSLGETSIPGRHVARVARYADGYVGIGDSVWGQGGDPMATSSTTGEQIERQKQLSPEESRVRLVRRTDDLRSRIDDAKQVSANQQVSNLLESLNTRKCETQGRAKYERELNPNTSILELLQEAADKITDEHERSHALKAIDDLRRELNSDPRPGSRVRLTPANPQVQRSAALLGTNRPNLYYVRGEEKRSGAEDHTKPLHPTAQDRISRCRATEFWNICSREAYLLGFNEEHPLCKNYTFCGRYAEIYSVESEGNINYRTHCCISCRDTKGLADFAMGHAIECSEVCGKLGAIFTARGLSRPNDRNIYLTAWRSNCQDIIRRMDNKYDKLQAAGVRVPSGWVRCDEERRRQLKAFAKGRNNMFFPGGWLRTADMLADAQADGYKLSAADNASGSSSSSSGNTLGAEASRSNENSNEPEGTGNVPSSAQGTDSSLSVPQSANANEESPNAQPDGDDEVADYEHEE